MCLTLMSAWGWSSCPELTSQSPTLHGPVSTGNFPRSEDMELWPPDHQLVAPEGLDAVGGGEDVQGIPQRAAAQVLRARLQGSLTLI